MDLIKDDEVVRIIERCGYHYHLNIANRVLRPYILQLYLDERTWNNIELFTEKLELYRYKGFRLDDLYKQVAACSRFIQTVRNGVHAIKTNVKTDTRAPDRLYREMTVNNLPNNLKVFAELVNSLFVILVDFDKKNSGDNLPLYTQMSELDNVSYVLTSG